MSETRRRSVETFNRRNRLVNAKNRPRQFIHTPLGRALTFDEFLKPLVDFLAGKLDEKPVLPPKFVREPLQQLDNPSFLALTALVRLLDSIVGDDRDDPSWEAALKEKVGDDIYQELRKKPLARGAKKRVLRKKPLASRWGAKERVQAGDWLLRQAMALDIFGYDEDGLPCISDIDNVAELQERLIEAGAVFAPLLKPPPPWTGSEKTYDDGFRVKFVRDWRPETKTAIDVAFLNPTFEHAKGVNALAGVPLKIDPVMLDLVERFAVELMGNNGAKRRADQTTVAADVAHAKYCVEHGTIWNDYSCDRRGRIYALQHLNFARGDHVRSLFKFANGMRLEPCAKRHRTYWLEIHCANCEGSTDKESRDARIKWVDAHREDIKAIKKDPIGTFERWKDAGKPFAFVAACRELAAAWEDPENFETHLPIGFDGSANGLQHLALLINDGASAELVNLLTRDEGVVRTNERGEVEARPADDHPSDVYATLIAKAIQLILADPCDHARWWRECFKTLLPKQQRKLLKQPIMTFAYSVTPAGATDQIEQVYKSFRRNAKPPKGAFRYLAEKVLEACALELSGPKSVMDYICRVAEHCTAQKRFMEWTSPSGFPVFNRYQKLNLISVTCLRGTVRVAQHRIADGVTDRINRKKVKHAAAPNFIHSLDAAHLIKVVNAAVSEGIIDLLTIHDGYYCLAPQATRLHSIIVEQLADLYRNNDPLTDLRSRNVSDPDILPVPPEGTPWPIICQDGHVFELRFVFAPAQVARATNAFR